MSVLSPRIVPIDNGINFRDLGGIPTKDGRKVKQGLLFRSGDFAGLTPTEQIFLSDQLKLKHVLDYRDQKEAKMRPNNLWKNSHYLNVPANPLTDEVTASLTKAFLNNEPSLKQNSPSAFMIKLYQLLPFNNSAYQTLSNLLLNNDGQAFVQHCAIGKDRTGVGVALTLFALGVDEELIMADYLLSDQLLTNYRDELLAQANLSEDELEKRKQLFAAKPDYLQSAISAIKTKYKTVDDWLENEYQLTPKNRQIIQNYYLI